MPRSPSPARERKRSRSRSRERDYKRRREEYDRRDRDREERRPGYDRRDRDERRVDHPGARDRERGGREWDRGGRGHERDGDRRGSRYSEPDRERDRERDRDRERRDREAGRPEEGAARSRGAADAGGADAAAQQGGAAPQPGSNGLAASKPKAEPLSLEELLKKRQQQQAEEAKPRFLTKAERERLALERRQQQVAAIRGDTAEAGRSEPDRRDAERRETERRETERREAERREHERREAERREHERREAERRDARRGPPGGPRDRGGRGGGGRDGRGEPRAEEPSEERERERALELIRQQYLGGEKAKKKVVRASEKFRFNFDWDAQDDTSRDLNPLYANLHEAQLLFGRGMRAGIDRREQKKAAASFEAANLSKLRSSAGITETDGMRAANQARLAAANDYEDMTIETHWSAKPLERMTERDWRIFREDFNITYRGHNPTLPLRAWDEAGLPPEIRKAIDRVGYAQPSPIQRAAIPLGVKQLDVIGVAETGSGKTAAFVIPMLLYIMRQPPMDETNEADGPYAVVLAPTRELAQQIEEETIKLAHYTGYRVTSIVGGQSIEEQGSKLRRGCEIVIATPGRLIDCLERHYAVLNQCNYVVLDEADRMIDLGFEPQVQGVLDAMPSSTLKPDEEGAVLQEGRTYRTTYMFSATMPTAVERLARKYLRRPVVVNIGSAGRATENVAQRVVMVKDNEKAHRLEAELELVVEKRCIVFVNTKRQCDNVYAQLSDLGYRCTVLHGGRTQDQREVSIKGFRDDTFNVLIATDVAGRGIDVPDVALVVNYDMPNTIEAYTHRIGRTGRAGKKGVAITFLTGGDTEVYYDLKRLLEDSKAPVPPELARHEAAKQKPGAMNNKRDQVQFARGT